MNKENSVWKMISDLENKKGITEIIINGPDAVFVERENQFIQLSVFPTASDIEEFIQDVAKFNHKECSIRRPICDGILPDGSRINIILSPFSVKNPSITIRKYLHRINSFEVEEGLFGLTHEWITFLKALVVSKMNILVTGGTGVGKTTFLNLLLNERNPHERVVVIEDTVELQIKGANVVRLEAGVKQYSDDIMITMRDLVKNSLRMRPDRVIVGEVRGCEVFDLLQALNTGHRGCMASIHANSVGETYSRIETLYLQNGINVPFLAIRRQIATAFNYIIHLGKDLSGKRIVENIMEITGMEADAITGHSIGKMNSGKLTYSGIMPKNMSLISNSSGIPLTYFDIFN